jgi:nucleotide-binding universal stress UspA family protein
VGDDGRLPERIVAAVDPTASVRRHRAAHAVLDWADWIADWVGAPATVVSAWQSLDWVVPDPDDDAAAELKRHREAVRRDAEQSLRALLDERSQPFARDRVHLIEGSPTEVLPRFTEGRASDLIVMGTLGRPDVVGDLIGETAETMIRNVHCSVLTVPPGSRPDAPTPLPDREPGRDRGSIPDEGARS